MFSFAEHFAARFAKEEGSQPVSIGAEARSRFAAHAWPGNVRELRNLIERLTRGELLAWPAYDDF